MNEVCPILILTTASGNFSAVGLIQKINPKHFKLSNYFMFYERSCIYLSFQRTYTDVYRTNKDHKTEQLVQECDW